MNLQRDIEKLNEKIKSSGKEIKYLAIDDKTLKRYLVAHKKVDAAYEKILATDKWRKETEVDKITAESPGVKRVVNGPRLARVLDARDFLKRPVFYVAVRNHSFKNRDIDDYTLYMLYMMEMGVKLCLDEGLDNVCAVFDLKDFALTCMDYPLAKILYTTLQDHYPEGLGMCLVLNAPLIFSACWAILKGWLDENTASKIKFMKDDEELAQYLDPSSIPMDM